MSWKANGYHDLPTPAGAPTPQDRMYIGNTGRTLWRIDSKRFDGSLPVTGLMYFPPEVGAFKGVETLKKIRIPESVKAIGERSFEGTSLTAVTIADDCTYSKTSFPPECKISTYGGDDEYGQLYDGDGMAVLDGDGARVYVRG